MTSSEKLGVKISETKPQEDEKVKQFLAKNFFADSPLSAALGEKTKHHSPLELVVVRQDRRDFTVKAEDLAGQLIGVAVLQAKFLSWQDCSTESGKKVKEVHEYLIKNAVLDELPGETLVYRAIAVSPEYRNSGLARQLTDECNKLARDKGFNSAWVMCVSEFSARLARNFGWKERYRMAYKDYPLTRLQPVPPHEHAYIYTVTDLQRIPSHL